MIDGLIVTEAAGVSSIVGFTGGPFECEGCRDTVSEVFYSDDDVQLCEPCLKACEEEEQRCL
jgi:hypothetical protein